MIVNPRGLQFGLQFTIRRTPELLTTNLTTAVTSLSEEPSPPGSLCRAAVA